MLSSAETDLVRRDAAIPGLAMVLDPDSFATALRRAAPEADLRTAQITYRRYKPQAFCRVAYRLNVAGEELELDVRACRAEDVARWLEDGAPARVAGPPGPGRTALVGPPPLRTRSPNHSHPPPLPNPAAPC